VERLNYIQYHPMVLFLDPHSRKDVKAMRQKYNPNSNKSSRRLYSQAVKMRRDCSHLFSGNPQISANSFVLGYTWKLIGSSTFQELNTFFFFIFPDCYHQLEWTYSLTPTAGMRVWRIRFATSSPNLSGCLKSRYSTQLFLTHTRTHLHTLQI